SSPPAGQEGRRASPASAREWEGRSRAVTADAVRAVPPRVRCEAAQACGRPPLFSWLACLLLWSWSMAPGLSTRAAFRAPTAAILSPRRQCSNSPLTGKTILVKMPSGFRANLSRLHAAPQHARPSTAMPRPLIGPKIRDRRHALGITQASLAASLGISASYLNLIESNRRSIGGALLKRIGDALGLALEDLDGAAERRLVNDLGEIATEPMLAPLALDAAGAGELASRHGAWARALVSIHRAWRERDQAVNALVDRMSQDPFLGDAVHGMRTRAAAIRSASEILATVEDLAPADQRRFAAIIDAESARLADVAQALAAFFDKGRAGTRPAMPVEEVDDFLFERDNFFPTLEAAADEVRAAAS